MKPLRVLIGCEFSGVVREAFEACGHDAWSCDLLPSETKGQHLQMDIFEAIRLHGPWNELIAFPPCTFLCNSGVRWLVKAGGPSKYSQVIHPWQHGHGETKATCLWLKGLPLLVPSNIVAGRNPRVHRASPGPERWKERSRTLPGIAKAMSIQWGKL